MGIKNSRPERTPLQSDTAINRSTETSTRHTHELPPPYDPPPPFPEQAPSSSGHASIIFGPHGQLLRPSDYRNPIDGESLRRIFSGPVIPTEGSLPGRSAWVSPHTRGFYNAFQESSNVPTGVPPPEYSPDKRNQ